MTRLRLIATLSVIATLSLASFAHATENELIDQQRGNVMPQQTFKGESSVMVAQVPMWFCTANSNFGTGGSGYGVTQQIAANYAMAQCRMNTPYGYYCVISGCTF